MPDLPAAPGNPDTQAIMQAAQAFLNPDHAGMPDHIDGDWRLPADCEEPARGKPAKTASP